MSFNSGPIHIQFRVHGSNSQQLANIDAHADECPICHRHIDPSVVAAVYLPKKRIGQIVYQCTNNACSEIFVGSFMDMGSGRLRLERTEPKRPVPIVVPELVSAISPMYIAVMNQVIAADTVGLDQLVGIGMRKAIEFLVKDFAIKEYPDKEKAIKEATLAQCINNYLDDTRIRESAKRATWLGNDETHYVRKWETKDLNDLKVLVRLTVNWIESHLLTKQYRTEMP